MRSHEIWWTKLRTPHLGAGVLGVAVQISEHAGEGVDVGVYFGVIACWFFRTAVLRARQTRVSAEFRAADSRTVEATEHTPTMNS